MAWSAPRTWVANAILQAAQLNTDIRDNLNYLKGLLDGTSSGDPIVQPAGEANGYRLGASGARARLFTAFSPAIPFLTFNAAFSGSWNRDDTAVEAALLDLRPAAGGAFQLQYATAGANPITWTTALQLDGTGKLTGAAVWNSGRFAVAAGATVDTNHTWLTFSLRPAFVLGFYQAGTQTPDNNVQQVCGMGPASTEKVRITLVDASKVRVVSGDSVSNTVVLYAIVGPTS
jgi:hypothetical protein